MINLPDPRSLPQLQASGKGHIGCEHWSLLLSCGHFLSPLERCIAWEECLMLSREQLWNVILLGQTTADIRNATILYWLHYNSASIVLGYVYYLFYLGLPQLLIALVYWVMCAISDTWWESPTIFLPLRSPRKWCVDRVALFLGIWCLF